jgi:hypothetical protein
VLYSLCLSPENWLSGLSNFCSSSTPGQIGSRNMRNFGLPQEPCRESGVTEPAGVSPMYGATACHLRCCIGGPAVAQTGSTVALKRDAQRKPRKDDANERYKAEIARLRVARKTWSKANLRLDDLSRVQQTNAQVMQVSTSRGRFLPRVVVQVDVKRHRVGSLIAPLARSAGYLLPLRCERIKNSQRDLGCRGRTISP